MGIEESGVRSQEGKRGALRWLDWLKAAPQPGKPAFRSFLRCFFLILVPCTWYLVPGFCLAQPSPFDGLKKTYSAITTLETGFRQKIHIASLNKERQFEGEFWYKRGKGFLWRYSRPKTKYFLYDGRHIFQGEEDKPFIMKDRINKEKTGGTFLDLVEDVTRIDQLFTLKGQGISGAFDVLDLVPKKDSTVNSARVWIDKEQVVRKVEIREFTGNVNTIEFFGIKVNRPVDDGRFVFRPEKDKEVIER